MAFPLVTGVATRRAVRKHRAPNGALRPDSTASCRRHDDSVRKYRAPKGALRPSVEVLDGVLSAAAESTERQKVH